MKREEMDAIIQEDRQHIGYGAPGTPQRMLHGTFTSARMAQLGSKGDQSRSRGDALQAAIAALHVSHPDFQPEYDHEYFRD